MLFPSFDVNKQKGRANPASGEPGLSYAPQ
jgi:hypothetical protein